MARRFRTRYGEEVDLIGIDGNTLVFFEIRARAENPIQGATGSVSYTKQKRIIQAAKVFLYTQKSYQSFPARFDVIGITLRNHTKSINWIKAAFNEEGSWVH